MYRFGVDVGGTNIAIALFDDDLSMIVKQSIKFPHTSPEETAELIRSSMLDICEKTNIKMDSVDRIGVCIPGSVDVNRGIVIDAFNLAFHNVPLKKIMEQTIGKPTHIMNDADAATLAEFKLGSLKGTNNSMLITIGTGIGGGIICNGHLFHGGNGNGIELGHVQMDLHGQICTCGRRGCVETLCSAVYLKNKALELFDSGTTSMNRYAREKIDAKILIDEARNGDKQCLDCWQLYVDNLAEALASYANFIDPEKIAVGGGVCGAGDFLFTALRMRFAEKCFFVNNLPDIVCAELGNDAGLFGSII